LHEEDLQMAVLSILNQKAGPLPITATFNSPTNAPATIYIAGSVWSPNANKMIGISVQLDGQAIGSSQIFSNGSATHRATVPSFIPVTLTIGPHTLTLAKANGDTTSDVNDFFEAMLLY
jgi:hypothetical protein